MKTFSPAPWTVERNQVRDKDGNVLASVPYSLGDETDTANARLISFAPELLEACKKVEGLLRYSGCEGLPTYENLKRVIEKAEGK